MNIYFDGRIYEGVAAGESRYNYPSYPVSGIHNFKNGQEVTGLYELKHQILHEASRKYVDINTREYEVLYGDKRIVAVPTSPLPLPNNEAGEKAKELVEKYMSELFYIADVINKRFPTAKECALICIDDILDVLNKLLESGLHNDFGILDKRGYWQSVREAVNTL